MKLLDLALALAFQKRNSACLQVRHTDNIHQSEFPFFLDYILDPTWLCLGLNPGSALGHQLVLRIEPMSAPVKQAPYALFYLSGLAPSIFFFFRGTLSWGDTVGY